MNKEQLLRFFVALSPEFEKYWHSEGEIYRDDGDFSIYGVSTVFSWYFRNNYREFSHRNLILFFQKIEETFDDENLDAANALCTCFLENIAGEEVGNFSRKFMGNNSKEFFDNWN